MKNIYSVGVKDFTLNITFKKEKSDFRTEKINLTFFINYSDDENHWNEINIINWLKKQKEIILETLIQDFISFIANKIIEDINLQKIKWNKIYIKTEHFQINQPKSICFEREINNI